MAERQMDLFGHLKELFVDAVKQEEQLVAANCSSAIASCRGISPRSSSRLKQGDLVIVAIEAIRKATGSEGQPCGQEEAAKAIVERLSHMKGKPKFFQSFAVTPAGHVAAFLVRHLVYAACIGEVRKAGARYGFASTCTEEISPPCSKSEVLVFLHNAPHAVDAQCGIESRTCTLVRSELLAVLLTHLLKHTGQKATLVTDAKVCMPIRASLTQTDLGQVNEELATRLPMCIDVQDMVKSYKSLQGKCGLCDLKNFHTAAPSGALTSEAVYGLRLAAVLGPYSHVRHKCLHVCSHGNSYFTQKSLAVALCQDTKLLLNHHMVAHCGVRDATTGSSDVLFSSLYRTRLHQMEAACAVKCGDAPPNSTLLHTASTVADAVIRFELLATDLNSPVKLSFRDPADGSQSKSTGSFVLYNYARMCTVLANFDKSVAVGIYPDLPSVDTIDFSLLREEAEWSLLFKYILQFPSLTDELASFLGDGAFRIATKVNKLCSFLLQLSSDYSVYYSKVRVLLDPQPHLFPLVHARVYLLLSIRQVMYNALHLLGIEPLEKL